MEEKLFELMTKMYSDITSKLEAMDKKLDKKADKSDIVHIENKSDTNTKALFDGYKQFYEKLNILDNKINELSSKVEKQEVEVKVIKGGKS
ncbi:MAG: hypothetical protein N3B21_14240 [Clostridia bacterium]|nr:hypothetical protein [Clostridia bacterium]